MNMRQRLSEMKNHFMHSSILSFHKKMIRRKYMVLAVTGLGMLLGYQNCAPVMYKDVSPYSIKQGIAGSGQAIVSAALNKQTVDGYTVSLSAGHFVDGIEKKVDGYKVYISVQGEMNSETWENKIMTRQ